MIAALYVVSFIAEGGFTQTAIVNLVLTLVIAQAAYFHMKHLMIPDVKGGVVRSIRSYNLLALIYAVLCMLEMTVTALPAKNWMYLAVYVPMCVIMLIIMVKYTPRTNAEVSGSGYYADSTEYGYLYQMN